MSFDLDALPPEVITFLTDRHLATLTTLRADGRPHVAPVGFTYDPQNRIARVITSAAARKAINAQGDERVAICQVDGGYWLTLEGCAVVSADAAQVADAVARYTARYRVPRDNPTRVVIEVHVERMMGRAPQPAT